MGVELNSHNFLSAVLFLVHRVDFCSQMVIEIIKIPRLFSWTTQKTEEFCVTNFATISHERRLVREPEGLRRSKIFGILQTVLTSLQETTEDK